jgi:opacity protein-like surface antigen
MRKYFGYVIAALLILGTFSARAKDGGKLSLGVGGGYILAQLKDGFDRGWQAGGRVDIPFGSMFFVDIGGEYMSYKSDPSGVDFTSFGGGGGLGVKWGSKVSPYASVGAEYAILKAKAGSLTLPDTKGMALQARLGVEFMVSSSVGIFAEGEYKHIFKSGAPRMIIANGGAMFHF